MPCSGANTLDRHVMSFSHSQSPRLFVHPLHAVTYRFLCLALFQCSGLLLTMPNLSSLCALRQPHSRHRATPVLFDPSSLPPRDAHPIATTGRECDPRIPGTAGSGWIPTIAMRLREGIGSWILSRAEGRQTPTDIDRRVGCIFLEAVEASTC